MDEKRRQNLAVCTWAWLQELSEGLVALSGRRPGLLGKRCSKGMKQELPALALKLAGIFPHRFYMELQRAGRADDESHVAAAVQWRQAPVAGGGDPSHPVSDG